MLSPRTASLVAMTTLPWTDGRVPLRVGRAMVPVGGVMPKRVSNGVAPEPVTPWPISHSLVFKVIPLVAVPVYRKMGWPESSTAAAEARLLNGLASVPEPLLAAAGLTNQMTGLATLNVAAAVALHLPGAGLPLSHTV